jgi:hypothetical protein
MSRALQPPFRRIVSKIADIGKPLNAPQRKLDVVMFWAGLGLSILYLLLGLAEIRAHRTGFFGPFNIAAGFVWFGIAIVRFRRLAISRRGS